MEKEERLKELAVKVGNLEKKIFFSFVLGYPVVAGGLMFLGDSFYNGKGGAFGLLASLSLPYFLIKNIDSFYNPLFKKYGVSSEDWEKYYLEHQD
jgi:hypothetical protein